MQLEEQAVLMQTILGINEGNRLQTLIDFSTIEDLLEIQKATILFNGTKRKKDLTFMAVMSQRLDVAIAQGNDISI